MFSLSSSSLSYTDISVKEGKCYETHSAQCIARSKPHRACLGSVHAPQRVNTHTPIRTRHMNKLIMDIDHQTLLLESAPVSTLFGSSHCPHNRANLSVGFNAEDEDECKRNTTVLRSVCAHVRVCAITKDVYIERFTRLFRSCHGAHT